MYKIILLVFVGLFCVSCTEKKSEEIVKTKIIDKDIKSKMKNKFQVGDCLLWHDEVKVLEEKWGYEDSTFRCIIAVGNKHYRYIYLVLGDSFDDRHSSYSKSFEDVEKYMVKVPCGKIDCRRVK